MRMIGGLGAIASQYDVFLLDQYGVLHNGEALLPGVPETLSALHEMKKELIVVSNTSKRLAALVGELPNRGFREEWLTGAVCSGEECYRSLCEKYDGKKALLLGWTRDGDTSYLPEGVSASSYEDCDVIVAHGPDLIWENDEVSHVTSFKETGDLSPYARAFESCVRREVPMLCANPDLVSVDPSGKHLNMPGKLVQAYREMGGRVEEFGKPDPYVFDAGRRKASGKRIIHVGDSLMHDILGASRAQIDSLFIVHPGVHADDLRDDASPEAVVALSDKLECPPPTYCASRFRL